MIRPSKRPPVAIVYRLEDVPVARRLVRHLPGADALRDAAHFVHPSLGEETTRFLWEREEPAIDDTLSSDLLAIDDTLADALREALETDARLKFGFHAALDVDAAADALARGGFEVVRYAELAAFHSRPEDEADTLERVRRTFDAAFGLDAIEAFLRSGGELVLSAERRVALHDQGLGAARFAEALGPRVERWNAVHHRLLDVFARVFDDGDVPRFRDGFGDIGLDRTQRLVDALVERNVKRSSVLARNAAVGVVPDAWPSRGWHAVEQLFAPDEGIDGLSIDDARRVIDRALLDAPTKLLGISAMRSAIARLLADERGLLSAAALRVLTRAGVATASDVVKSVERLASKPDRGTSSPDLGHVLVAMRGGEPDPRYTGPGREPGLFGMSTPIATRKRVPHITDVRWTRRGDRLLVVADDVRVLQRAAGGPCRAENASGIVELAPIRDYAPIPLGGSTKDDIVLSADFDARGRILTGWRHGTLRRGAADVDVAEHEVIARFDAPVFRVRVSPSSDAIALIVGRELVLHGDPPRTCGEATTGDAVGRTVDPASYFWREGAKAYVAWAVDGRSLAVCCDGDVVVYDDRGDLVRRVRICGDFDAHGGIDASPTGFVVPKVEGLAIVSNDGTLREIPRFRRGESGTSPGRAAASADGRVVAVRMTREQHIDAPESLEIFDLHTQRGYLAGWYAKQLPHAPLAFSPSGDALIYGSTTSLWIEAFGLEAGRDEAAELLSLATVLKLAGHHAEARSVLGHVHVPSHRRKLALALTTEKHVQAPIAPKVPEGKPPPLVRRAAKAADGFEEGQTVEHARLGRGVVVDVDGEGGDALVTIELEGGQERKLRASTLVRVD